MGWTAQWFNYTKERPVVHEYIRVSTDFYNMTWSLTSSLTVTDPQGKKHVFKQGAKGNALKSARELLKKECGRKLTFAADNEPELKLPPKEDFIPCPRCARNKRDRNVVKN